MFLRYHDGVCEADGWMVGRSNRFSRCACRRGKCERGEEEGGGGHVGDLLFIGGLNVADDAGMFTASQLA